MRIDWVELAAPDLAAMKTFYGAAFGWTFTDYGGQYADFHGAGVTGGFNPQRDVSGDAGALIVLFAEDLLAAERAITIAGGKVDAHEEFPGGRRFTFTDPCGNQLAVWTKA